MSQRFGPLQSWDFDEKESPMFDYVNNCGEGLMGFSGVIPEECFQFLLDQYARFNIPVNEGIYEAISFAAASVFWYVDIFDPYTLFHGLSDVDITDEWSKYTYEILDPDFGPYEANPEDFETFVYAPGQSEAMFNAIMSKPALEALPFGLGNDLRENLEEGYCCGEGIYCAISIKTRWHLDQLCMMPDGCVNATRVNAYLNLAVWGAFAWLVGPLSRNYRMARHDVFNMAITFGQAVLLDGECLSPQKYRKLDRPVLSCYKCGLAAWCTEMTLVEGSTRYICEHCLSEGMPRTPMASCGSKRCTLTQCAHHPYHNMGVGGFRQALREHGQLRYAPAGSATSIAESLKVKELPG